MKVVEDFRRLISIAFIIYSLQLYHVGCTPTNVYGVDLELIKIRPSQPPNSFQFELQVDYAHSGNMIDYGMVTVRTVASNHELIFPEFANRNPFNLRVESQGVICFHLYQTNKLILEDCLQIRDLTNNYFYNTETFTKTKADGTTLTYKISQYLINSNNNNHENHVNHINHELSDSQFVADAQSSCPVCSCSCTLAVVFAVLEGLSLFVVILIFIYWRHHRNKTKSTSENQSVPITVANNGGGMTKTSSTLAWTTTNADVKQQQNEIYSNGNSISSNSSNTENSTETNDDGTSSTTTTIRTFFKALTSMSKKIGEIFRNAKLKTSDEPPEPPPPDYRNEAFDVDDPPERVYDSIDDRKLSNIVYTK